jgi:hypothetical protein
MFNFENPMPDYAKLLEDYDAGNEELFDELYVETQNNPKDVARCFYFSVESENTAVITPGYYFEQEGALFDQSMPIVDILLSEDGYELASSYYEFENANTKEELKLYLLEKGFVESQELTDFLNSI